MRKRIHLFLLAILVIGGLVVVLQPSKFLKGSLLSNQGIAIALKNRSDTDGNGELSVREIRTTLIAIIRGVILGHAEDDINGDGAVNRGDVSATVRGFRGLMSAVCGNGVEEGTEEQCDGPATSGCSSECRLGLGDLIITIDGPGFTRNGPWVRVNNQMKVPALNSSICTGQTNCVMTQNADALWIFENLPVGEYEVYARWRTPSQPLYPPSPHFIFDGSDQVSVVSYPTVSAERDASGNWGKLGSYAINSGTLKVKTTNSVGWLNSQYTADVLIGSIMVRRSICGDGYREGGETCEDGNTTGSDGCSGSCQIEAGYECDTSVTPNTCSLIVECGNGVVQGGEECDDGNTSETDSCSNDCRKLAIATYKNSEWKAVTYGNGLFVAVANNGNGRIMTSPDGITWTGRTSPAAQTWRSVAYGNGRFVAISGDLVTPKFMTSPDGIVWTAQPAPEDSPWLDVVFGNGLFVAVTNYGDNRIATSSDGINWTPRVAPEQNSWTSITYGNGLFVAVSNHIMTSPDGITWSIQSTPEPQIYWEDIAYGGGVFTTITASSLHNKTMTSPDGITWTQSSAAGTGVWDGLAYGNGIFVAVAVSNNSEIMTSTDGVNWTLTPIPDAGYWNGVVFADGKFVAVSSTGKYRVMTSADGIHWTSTAGVTSN